MTAPTTPAYTFTWDKALEAVLPRLERSGVPWLLLGSAAMAVQGAPVKPADLDFLVQTARELKAFAKAMHDLARPGGTVYPTNTPVTEEWASSQAQPVLEFGGESESSSFARWVLNGVKVEAAHRDIAGERGLLLEAGGELVWRERRLVAWRGQIVPVVPVEVQLATTVLRGLDERDAVLVSTLREGSYRRDLLERAFRDRGLDAAPYLARLS